MEKTDIDLQIVLELYSNRLAQAEYRCILLEAELLTLRNKYEGGDANGKVNDNTSVG